MFSSLTRGSIQAAPQPVDSPPGAPFIVAARWIDLNHLGVTLQLDPAPEKLDDLAFVACGFSDAELPADADGSAVMTLPGKITVDVTVEQGLRGETLPEIVFETPSRALFIYACAADKAEDKNVGSPVPEPDPTPEPEPTPDPDPTPTPEA